VQTGLAGTRERIVHGVAGHGASWQIADHASHEALRVREPLLDEALDRVDAVLRHEVLHAPLRNARSSDRR
jgi:hypothetical protein